MISRIDSELETIDAVLNGMTAGGDTPALAVDDAKYVLEATYGDMAPVIAIVRAHKAAIADREAEIHFWVRVYLSIQAERQPS